MEIREAQRKRVAKIINILKKEYPGVKTALNYSTPLELLVATILSAQCTDVRVNKVTATLFKKYKSAKDYADAEPAVLEEDIRSTGFYRNKAKSIKSCCREIVEKFNGVVPNTMAELVTLSGVGRKTANVILGSAFGIPGIVVDTHVRRLAQRVGLTTEDDPDKIEYALMDIIPEKDWIVFSFLFIEHGRNICQARKPRCYECKVRDLCAYPDKTVA